MKSKTWNRLIVKLKRPFRGRNKAVSGHDLLYEIEIVLDKIRKHYRESQRIIFGKIDDGVFISPSRKPVDLKSLDVVNRETKRIKNEEIEMRNQMSSVVSDAGALAELKSRADQCYISMKDVVEKLQKL